MRLLNIYGQPYWHADARIIGNREGLIELRRAIDRAVSGLPVPGISATKLLFASDGEGYTVTVECHDDKWGTASGENSFWNTEASQPEYTSLPEER